MFESKLAQSVQRDYRQAADNYRLSKEAGSSDNRFKPFKVIALVTPLIVLLVPFI